MNSNLLFILCACLLLSAKAWANVGGATMKPGIIGDPIVWQLTNISVAKEILSLRFYEKDHKKICAFTAVYDLQCDTNAAIAVNGIFYGLSARNIQVFFNDLPAPSQIDSANFKQIDQLIFRATHNQIEDASWYRWRNLSKTGFYLTYTPQQRNILKVTGELLLEPTELWYGIATQSIYAKHPFLNKKLSKDNELFHYLITPIETWKSVGEIEINVEYPAHWKADSYSLIPHFAQKNQQLIQQQFVFKDSIPSIFTLEFKKRKQYFFVGGGNIGFHGIGKPDFATKMGWEFGVYHNQFISTIIAVDYETNYSDYHQFCITATPTLPWIGCIVPCFGAGIGLPVRIVNQSIYTGVRLRTDFSWGLFNINLNWDFIPKRQVDGQKMSFYSLSF